MTEAEYNQALAKGNVNFVQPQQTQAEQSQEPEQDISQFYAVLHGIRSPRSFLTTAPTFTPKTFLDQIQFYDDGTNRRIYVYVNNTWRYTSLT